MNLSYCSKHRGDIIRGLFFLPTSFVFFAPFFCLICAPLGSIRSYKWKFAKHFGGKFNAHINKQHKLKSIRRVNHEMDAMHDSMY